MTSPRPQPEAAYRSPATAPTPPAPLRAPERHLDGTRLSGLALLLVGGAELLQAIVTAALSRGPDPRVYPFAVGTAAFFDLRWGLTLWRHASAEPERWQGTRTAALMRLALGTPYLLRGAALEQRWLHVALVALSSGALAVLLVYGERRARVTAAKLALASALGLSLALSGMYLVDRDLEGVLRAWTSRDFVRPTPQEARSDELGYRVPVLEGWHPETPEARRRRSVSANEVLEQPTLGGHVYLYAQRMPWNERLDLRASQRASLASLESTYGVATLLGALEVHAPASQLGAEYRFSSRPGGAPPLRVALLVSHQNGVVLHLSVVHRERSTARLREDTLRILSGVRHVAVATLRAPEHSREALPTPLVDGWLRDQGGRFECKLPVGWYRRGPLPPGEAPETLRAMAILPGVDLHLEVGRSLLQPGEEPTDHALALAWLEGTRRLPGYEDLGFVSSSERGVVALLRRTSEGRVTEALTLFHREGNEEYRFLAVGAPEDLAAHRREVDEILASCRVFAR